MPTSPVTQVAPPARIACYGTRVVATALGRRAALRGARVGGSVLPVAGVDLGRAAVPRTSVHGPMLRRLGTVFRRPIQKEIPR